MTDLPRDREVGAFQASAFQRLVALKAEHQAQKRDARQAWKAWYSGLDEEQKSAVDQQISQSCVAIAAEFGRPRRYRPTS